ncbi:DUF202 domain-containing protein [Streptomyces sp. RB6PN25]|uniref:DUF202 domain-containing protein n=1 Tax=Streptomyces humicola TaxID=2953240 RepID=A0ABT1Q223_9ACTN|nr:DUF202 domain-containing protein [Streptomyces humicola]MCQ4082805.1 DUF202 domain-containing protein [Streptomyces humicola]
MTGPERPERARRRAPEDVEDLDPGRARERTHLAWRRTASSFTAVSAAVAKFDPAGGVALLVMAAGVWTIATRHAAWRPDCTGAWARGRAVRTIALITGLTALISLLVAVFAEGRPS